MREVSEHQGSQLRGFGGVLLFDEMCKNPTSPSRGKFTESEYITLVFVWSVKQ